MILNSRLRCFVNLTTTADDGPAASGRRTGPARNLKTPVAPTEDSRQWSALRLARPLVGFVVIDLAERGVHDVIILDNLPPYKSAAAPHAIETGRAQILFHRHILRISTRSKRLRQIEGHPTRAVAEVYAEKGHEEKFVRESVHAWAKVMDADRLDVPQNPDSVEPMGIAEPSARN